MYFIEDRSGTIRSVDRGTLANRPASDVGQPGRWYVTSDAPRRIFEDLGNGLANGWVEVAGSSLGPATTAALGTVRMSTAPADAANPIAVGDNDTRNTNARTPTTHAASHAPGGSDALAVDAAAATGSLRTLGTTATSAAAGNHTHRISYGPWTWKGTPVVGTLAGALSDFPLEARTVTHLRIRAGTIPATGSGTLTAELYYNGALVGSVSLVSGTAYTNNINTTTGLAQAVADGGELRVFLTSVGTGFSDVVVMPFSA